jgi:hypothetical protein
VGDGLYGGVHRRVPHDLRAVQRLERPFLHAERLSITHPRTSERMVFIAPLADDLRVVLDAIEPALVTMLEQTEPGDDEPEEDK